ncbi:hypothetical protein [Anaeroselena agilis]|uniref:Uncharacterized protein n=1 Tax=Anaeroselena agilis TaxID=3063788 RepID=A0ABU3P4P6_9FIRM|nr:hypothetical protein [Selenomonadales bacterium 4137-cl]
MDIKTDGVFDFGSRTIARCTPEEIAACPVSYTGKFLGPVLEKGKKTTKKSKAV